jgi:hypothetical protein
MSRQQSLEAFVDSINLEGSLGNSTPFHHIVVKSSTGPLPVYSDKTKKGGQASISRLWRESNADLINNTEYRGVDLLMSPPVESLREEGTKDGVVSNSMPVQDQTMGGVLSDPLGSMESVPEGNCIVMGMGTSSKSTSPKFDLVTIEMAASKRQAALRLPQAPPGGFFYATLPALEE